MNKDIFKDQPTIGEGEDRAISVWVANWQTVNAWLQTHPTLEALKKAALFEAKSNGRVQILDRITIRIFKLEKNVALRKLLKK